jgi:predicted nuclease of restriction endonuclease-like (RecB) superfamily
VIQNAWSRNALEMQIESHLFRRQGKAVTNFRTTLPPAQSDLAQQLIKDPYNFDFLTLGADAQERDLENALLAQVQKFLIELGVGFALVGRQVMFKVGGNDFKVDLLFYHLKLRCFLVVELKMAEFQPEYTGKMNFYLSVVNDRMRHPTDGPSIGLILCRTKDELVAEYAIRDIGKPLGVAEFRLLEKLPQKLKGTLPTVEELQAELGNPGGAAGRKRGSLMITSPARSQRPKRNSKR